MVRTTADAVRLELDVSKTEYPSIDDSETSEEGIIDKWMQRAHILVDKRLPNEDNDALLTQIETLVAAHFGYARITGSEDGEEISSVKQGGRQLSFETGADGDEMSPYWMRAVALDSRIDDAPGDRWEVSVN